MKRLSILGSTGSIGVNSLNVIRNLEEKFFININPRNELYISFAKELGFSLIQHTYERDERYKI